MDNDKSNGIDGLYAENLKYARPRLFVLLALCISGMFVHGFLPESMLNVILVPVIKDKAKKIGSTDNYRPIALANVLSKLVENIMLNRRTNCLLLVINLVLSLNMVQTL